MKKERMTDMSIEERLDALEKEIQRLKDIEEIKNLKGQYFRCLDGKLIH